MMHHCCCMRTYSLEFMQKMAAAVLRHGMPGEEMFA